MTYCILNNVMIGVFIYILHVHHLFHAHATHELLGYVGGGVTPSSVLFCVVPLLSFYPDPPFSLDHC